MNIINILADIALVAMALYMTFLIMISSSLSKMKFILINTLVFVYLSFTASLYVNNHSQYTQSPLKLLTSALFIIVIASYLRRMYLIIFDNKAIDPGNYEPDALVVDRYGIYYMSIMFLVAIGTKILHEYNYGFTNFFGYGSYYTLYSIISFGLWLFYKNNHKNILKSWFTAYLAILTLGFTSSHLIEVYEKDIMKPRLPEYIIYDDLKIPSSTYFTVDTSGDYDIILSKSYELKKILKAKMLSKYKEKEIEDYIHGPMNFKIVNQNTMSEFDVINFINNGSIVNFAIHPHSSTSLKNNIFLKTLCYIFSFLSKEKSTPCKTYGCGYNGMIC